MAGSLVNLPGALRSVVLRLAPPRAPTRLWRDRDGVSALEFALVAPVLILMLLVSVESANLFLLRNEMVAATRDAARRLAVSSIDADSARALIQERLTGKTDATVDIVIQENELPDSAGTDIVVEVSVPIAEAMITGLGGTESSYEREEETLSGASPTLDGQSLDAKPSRSLLDDDQEEPDVVTSSDDGRLRIRASTTMLKEI